MNKDIVPELLERIETEFKNRTAKSETIRKKIAALKNSKVTHKDSNDLAIEVGKILSEVFTGEIRGDVLPDNKMYYNIAKRLLEPSLKRNFDIVGDYSRNVQEVLNKKANISLKAMKPELNQDRIDGIVNKISEYDDFEKGKWLLEEPIINFSQSIVDDTIKTNADFQHKAGLRPKVIREEAGNCCDWCKSLVGTYDYPEDVPKDVWRRHRYCRCTVDYLPEDGKKRDVWKNSRNIQKDLEYAEELRKRKEFSEIKSNQSPKRILNKLKEQSFSEVDIYDLAKNGKRHGGIYRDALIKNKSKLEKSIRSHYKQVIEHTDKIDNPEKYDRNWNRKTQMQKKGLLRKWEKDKKRNAEQAIVEIKLWEERFNE